MNIVYKSPNVKILDSTNPDAGYMLWKMSKDSVVKEDGAYVTIGEETLSQEDYRDRVLKMNMQYNNFPYFIFEIEGSILFRDLLYNLNKIAQWAVSLRLTHSVLDQSDSSNFIISEEYKGVKEWEDAFESYFTAMQDESRVDFNRIKMPYSMYSKYWIGINYRTLVELLSMLKSRMPFFYDVYGVQMASEYFKYTGIDITKYYVSNLSSGITKYFRSAEVPFIEKCEKIDDYYLLNQKMGLILYSQFIRQADTDVKGLYDMLGHSNPEQFKHKVFTGETIIDVTYLAHKDRVYKTLSNRTCWFSQSDGDETNPYYWSKFLNTFLSNIDYRELMDILPCKFCNGKLKSCHYAEDVKFRDQKLQKGYIPCAILNKSKDYAKQRISECNNKLNNLYLEITDYVINNGLVHTVSTTAWTSTLEIKTDIPLHADQFSMIITYLKIIKAKHRDYAPEFEHYEFPVKLTDFHKKFGLRNDLTCMLKGYAIDIIAKCLLDWGVKSFLINFGGDIFGYNTSAKVNIEGTKFNIVSEGIFSIFTSGNTDKRGNHIPGGLRGTTIVLVEWKSKYSNTLVDIMATKCHANSADKIAIMNALMDYDTYHTSYSFTEDGKYISGTYCASPFFNEDQIKVRDKMVSQFVNVFRPDLTESSKKYDEGSHNSHLVGNVVDDNISGIKSNSTLVFPVDTNDLGTLFEVGLATAMDRYIIKYDPSLDEYELRDYSEWTLMQVKDEPTLFDCSDKLQAISLGFCSHFMHSSNIYYRLNGCPDNIMLSVNYQHIEIDENGKYVPVKRDINERDM